MTGKRRQSRTFVIIAAALVLSASACNAESSSDAPTTSNGVPPASAGSAQAGGTLKVLGVGDIDHLDPATTSFVPNMALMRAVSRQLISYKTIDNAEARIVPEPDLATEVPTPTNDGRTYTFTLRDGISWDAPGGARQIVASDFVRGFKRLCNPAIPSPMLGYYVGLVEGMRGFCEGFGTVPPEAAPMKEYIETHDIAGFKAIDDKTLQIDLSESASDFIYMLSLTVATPAPAEVLAYVPDSPEYRSNFISSGPYTVDSYTPDKSLTLKRNPAWNPSSDPLRKAYVDRVEMTVGLTNDAIMQQIQAGTADMFYDITPPPAVVQQLRSSGDQKLSALPRGDVNPNIWINVKSSNNNGALKNLKVRQAIEYAVDKAAVVQTLGGTDFAVVQHGIFGPGVLGHHDFNLYPSDGDHGDPEKAKSLLEEAGYPDGLHIKMPYRNFDVEPQIAQTIQSSLQEAGFIVELIPVNSTDYYSTYIVNRDLTAAGEWDIAPTGWTPDWQGGAARSVFQPQYTYTGIAQTYNYVEYNNDEANALATKALGAMDQQEAAQLWGQVDETVMSDAIVVPVASRQAVLYHSDRVQDFIPWALSLQGDWTNVWLKP